jgi:hypothetical protein
MVISVKEHESIEILRMLRVGGFNVKGFKNFVLFVLLQTQGDFSRGAPI